jgi:arabinogalactan oligomer / maltooligosaccharide transport system substrate-binding protein
MAPKGKLMGRNRTLRALGFTLAVAIVGTVAASTAMSAGNATTIRIWVDSDRLPAITKVANAWGGSKGVTLDIVQKGSDSIRSDVKTVQADTAPDLIVGAHDWVGELSSNGSIVPLNPSKALQAGIAKGALDAFSYGVAIKRLYGAPVYTENVALITNTKLAKVPKTWASLETQALAAKKKLKQKVGIAVQQGTGDAYHMYPFFTSLCGYIFGRNKAGNLDPSDIGVANPKFLKVGAPEIDRWNKVGLISSSVTDGIAKQLFLTGKAAYYVTGPWFLDDIKKSGVKFAVSAFPNNKCATTPFTGVGGLMVTKFAAAHGVESLAKDFAANYMLRTGPQFTHYSVGGRLPVNLKAAEQIKDPYVKGFALSGAKGKSMPNIPQMNSVWTDLGQAWVRSTKGAGAMPARKSFIGAQRSIEQKIG